MLVLQVTALGLEEPGLLAEECGGLARNGGIARGESGSDGRSERLGACQCLRCFGLRLLVAAAEDPA